MSLPTFTPEQLFDEYYQQPFSTELSEIKLILSFWAEVLSLGCWRKKPLSECLLEDMKIQEIFHQKLNTFVRESPEAREQLRELVIALKVQALQAPFWEQRFIGRARTFAHLAEDVLENKPAI